jgi:hypothetical protein
VKPALPPLPPAAKGTVLGEQRREGPPIPKEKKELAAPTSSCSTAAPNPSKRYAEVSRLLIAGGARIPDIFNPSQLGGWLQIKERGCLPSLFCMCFLCFSFTYFLLCIFIFSIILYTAHNQWSSDICVFSIRCVLDFN